jgi:hypothetical protein
MKKIFTVNTRWEYYVSNVAGLIIATGVMIWFVILSFENGQIKFASLFFWMALLALIMILLGIISFFSSMKSVVVTEKGLLISYIFTKHKNTINFSAVTGFKSNVMSTATTVRSAKRKDVFKLTLADGSVFEFSRSQFDQYYKLKAMVYKTVVRN